VNHKRPVNLDLSTFRFPLSALTSITHRITGVILFAGIAVLLWLLDLSLSGSEGFAEASDLVGSPVAKFVVWAILSALAYHCVAGVKHLLMDLGIGESREGGPIAAKLVVVVSVVLIVLMGVWVW
jgi:succinate dehydrogenase / fumarate reductase cytochrome b subunit